MSNNKRNTPNRKSRQTLHKCIGKCGRLIPTTQQICKPCKQKQSKTRKQEQVQGGTQGKKKKRMKKTSRGK